MILAIAQLNTHAGAFEDTEARIVETCRAASEQGAELVVFPLCVLTGPLAQDRPEAKGHQCDLRATLDSIASQVDCACVVPAMLRTNEMDSHELYLLRDGKCTALRMAAGQRNRTQGQADAAGSEIVRFEHQGLRFVATFTYEGIDELVEAEKQADVVLFVSEYGYALDDPSSAMGAALSENRFGEDAVDLDAWFVGVSSLGGYGVLTYAGSSFVLSPRGDLRACAPSFEEALLFADVSAGGEGGADREDVSLTLEPEVYNRSLHLWESLALGLRDYVQKTGHEDVALALDDTMASYLLAALASDALGPMHVHAVPSAGASDECLAHVRDFAATLRIALEPGGIISVADDADKRTRADVTQLELARMARRLHAVSISPEDKTYLAVEATPEVCRAAELLPFGDVYRSDLIELAHLRNTISPVFFPGSYRSYDVPQIEGLQELEPTPELRLKRLDVTLCNYIEWGRSLSACIARQGAQDVTTGILRLVRDHQVGRDAWPLCLVASSRPLFMVRTPLGYAWHDRPRKYQEVREEDALSGSQDVLGLLENLVGIDGADGQQAQVPDLSGLLEGLDVELMSGSLPEGVDRHMLEGVLGDLFGLLQDMSQNNERPAVEGPFGPLTWGSPFSEN